MPLQILVERRYFFKGDGLKQEEGRLKSPKEKWVSYYYHYYYSSFSFSFLLFLSFSFV